MKGFSTDSLAYDSECGWVVERPKIYFNKDLFCEGESLKVILRGPYRSRYRLQDNIFLRVSHLSDEGETFDKVFEEHLVQPYWGPGFIQMVGTGAEELLHEGAYIAQVFPVEFDSAEGGVDDDRHQFQVLNHDEYWEQWRDLFGEEWDDPIFLDEMDSISREVRSRESSEEGTEVASATGIQLGEELMRGLPIQGILNVLPEQAIWDAGTILQLLGPITSAFMLDERGHLPFNTTFSLKQSSSRVPHIDLTKVIWLLSVIGPAFRDILFDAYDSHISVETNGETLGLIIRGKYPYPDRYERYGSLLRNREALIKVPEIFRIVQELAGKHFNFKLDYNSDETIIYFY